MLRRSARVVALIAVATLAHAERATPGTLAPQLAVEKVRLDNGLDVIFAPDPSVTNVVVHVRYAGGAATETAAQNGYTHLVEHLLFLGSVHVKSGDYDKQIDAAGGFTGTVVSPEHLSVYEQVPAGALDLALFLEAERMAGLADGITDAGVTTAREAVLGEMTSMYAPNGWGLVERAVRQGLWPAGHPYHGGTYGDEAVVKRATRANLRAFAKERIRPGNATLVIAGAFDVASARERVRAYFGWIPDQRRSAATPRENAPLSKQVTAHVYDPVPKVVVAWRLPSPHDPDLVALEVAARLLEQRFHNGFVKRDGAREVQATIVHHTSSAELQITLLPAIDVRDVPQPLVDAIVTNVAWLAETPLEADTLASAVAGYETELLLELENLVTRADALARWHGEGEDRLVTLPAQLRAITPASLQRAAKTWLVESASVVVQGDTP